MPARTPHTSSALSTALGVLVVGVLLLQHVPLRPLAHRVTDGSGYGCAEQVCRCGDACTCSHCAHHGAESAEEAGSAGSPASSNGPALRSCGTARQGPLGAFVVAKSLFAPAPLRIAAPHPAPPASPGPDALVPQRLGDDIFHPPKERIGEPGRVA